MDKGFDISQATAEANRCLLCHDAPCSTACPAKTDPGQFIKKLKMKNVTGAIRTIKENNILGGACGVLCPTAELCEKACVATGIDRHIRIGKIQRALVEHSWEINFHPLKNKTAGKHHVAVIGSGPAGLSCASELAKNGVQVTVFEKHAEPGGVLRYGVPSYRFSKEYLEQELKDVRELGVTIKCSTPIKNQKEAEDLLQKGYDAVFLAPGLWAPQRLKDGGEKAQGLWDAIEFLKEAKDKTDKMFSDKTVAVIGGGSVAIDCAESAFNLGAKDVYLVYRRSYSQMPAQEDERLSSLNQGIHYLLLNQPVDFEADNNQITGLKLVRTELGAPDDSGRRRPVEIPGSEWTLKTDVVIEAIGTQAEADSPTWYPSVNVDKKKLIQINKETGQTNVKGIFAGGDIVRGPSLIVNAVQDGKVAAWEIIKTISGEEV